MLGRTSVNSCSAQSIFCTTSISVRNYCIQFDEVSTTAANVLVQPEHVSGSYARLTSWRPRSVGAVRASRTGKLVLAREVHVLATGAVRLERGEAPPDPATPSSPTAIDIHSYIFL